MDKTSVYPVLEQFRMMIVEEGLCPDCLKRLNDDLVCRCGYDYWEGLEDEYEDED